MKKLFLILFSIFSLHSFALEIPNEIKEKTITLVSHSTPGGQNDIIARGIAKKVQEQTGLNIVVLNKPGASGNIGAKFVQNSDPNGLTLCHCDIQSMLYNDLLGVSDSIKIGDMKPIIIIRESPFAVVVPYNSKISTISDLLEQAQRRELIFSSFGTATDIWSSMLLSLNPQHKPILTVNYKGDPENIIAVAQEVADFTVAGLSSATNFEKLKKVKIIAVSSSKRLPQLEQYPTILESYNFALASWSGIFAPVGMPQHISLYYNTIFANAIKDKEFQEFLALRGAAPLDKNDLKSSTLYYENQFKFYRDSYRVKKPAN